MTVPAGAGEPPIVTFPKNWWGRVGGVPPAAAAPVTRAMMRTSAIPCCGFTFSPSCANGTKRLCVGHVEPVALHGVHRALFAVAATCTAEDRDLVVLFLCVEPDERGPVVLTDKRAAADLGLVAGIR